MNIQDFISCSAVGFQEPKWCLFYFVVFGFGGFFQQFQDALNVLSFLKKESFLKVGLHHLRMLLSIYSCCLLANALLAQGHFSLWKCPNVRLQNWWKSSNLAFWTLVGGTSIAQLSVSCWGSLTLQRLLANL